MAKVRNLTVAGSGSFARPPAAPTEAVRKSEFDALGLRVDGNTASIIEEHEARVTAEEAEASYRLALIAQMGENESAITLELQVRATADAAEATARLALTSVVAANTASLVVEAQTRADADSAEAALRIALAVRVTNAEAALTIEASTRASADAAEAALRIALAAQVAANTAALTIEATTRATADTAEATLRIALTAQVASNTAAITAEATTRASADSAEAALRVTLTARVSTAEAAIVTEQTVRATADTAESTARTTLAATVAGHTTAITTEATVRQAADNQFSARWGVGINNDGKVIGRINLDGTNASSTFSMSVDNVELTTPSYPANPYPTKILRSDNSGNRFQTLLGSGTGNLFIVSGGSTVTRNAEVWSLGSLKGVGVGSGYDELRLRHPGTNRFVIRAVGQCKNLTVWYRIPSLGSQWRLFAAGGWLASSSPTVGADIAAFTDPPTAAQMTTLRTFVNALKSDLVSGRSAFHTISIFSQQDIGVGATDTIEFGYNGLDGFGNGDATDANNDIYEGAMMVEVLNW